MWIQILEKEYNRLKAEILYKAMAGGRMRRGGQYTEYTPHSALNPQYPDLRVEMSNDMKEKRHFVNVPYYD
jgi:hypothetical protein